MSTLLTKPGFKLFDITPLRSALPPNLVVQTHMPESFASPACRPVAVAFELPFPTYNAGNTLLFRRNAMA